MYNPDHPDADYSGFTSRKSKTICRNKSCIGSQMAEVFAAPPSREIPKVPYVYDSGGGGLIGGPSYPDLNQYKSSAQAMQDGDPTEKGEGGKKKLTKSGPTIPISPVTGLPLCNYGDWAQKYDEANDTQIKPKSKSRPRPQSDPTLENLKKQLEARGAKGLVGLQRKFKLMDDDGSGQLSRSEFKKGMKELALLLTNSELDKLFQRFDSDKSGTISFDELLVQVRGELNDRRYELVQEAFQLLDSDGSGVVDADEIAAKYDASKHPDVQTGKKSEKDVLIEFLQTFDVGGDFDGKVTFNEFVNYYTNIGSSIGSDNYFELMIRNAWHMSGGEGEAANSSNLRVLITQADGTQKVVEVKNDLGIKNKNDPDFQRDLEDRLRQQGLRNFHIAKYMTKADLSDSKGNMEYDKSTVENLKAASEKAKEVARVAAMGAIEKLRKQLIARGATGFCGLQRKFRIMDDDGSKSLDKEEFKKALREMAIQLTNSEFEIMFDIFDRDKSGTISFDELLVEIRGPLSEKRKKLVHMAFDILDSDRNGAIDGEEIASKYDASKHPDVVAGNKQPKEILLEFLHTFDVGGEVDGKVTRAEFENYYSNISASIDDDEYFELMIRNAWHISGGEGNAACTSNLHVLVTRSDGTQGVVEVRNDLGMMDKKEKGFQEQLMTRLAQQGITGIKSADTRGEVGDGDGKNQLEELMCGAPSSKSTSNVMPCKEGNSWKNRDGTGKVLVEDRLKVMRPRPPLSATEPAPFFAGESLRVDHPTIDKIRLQLKKIGLRGFVDLQRSMKSNETNSCGLLDKSQFLRVFRDSPIRIPTFDLERLFVFLDKGSKGVIFTETFFDDVRGTIEVGRKYIVRVAFDKLDDQCNGELEPNVLISSYCADRHPQVLVGDRTESDVLTEFLESCDVGGNKEGKITESDFENYHWNLSATIESDVDFEILMRNVWDLGEGSLQLRSQGKARDHRIMRFRQRSPPPPALRTFPITAAMNTSTDTDQVSLSSIATRRQEILKMPAISKVPVLSGVGEQRELFSQAVPQGQKITSTKAVDTTIIGKPTLSAPPKVVIDIQSQNWLQGNTSKVSRPSVAGVPEKSEASILEDIKSLKVQAMLAKSQKNYVQSRTCVEKAYNLMVILYTKENIECKKLAEQIAALDVLVKEGDKIRKL